MKKFEINCENYQKVTQTLRVQMLSEKCHRQTCSVQGGHKPSIHKKQYLRSTMKQGRPVLSPLADVSCLVFFFLPAKEELL